MAPGDENIHFHKTMIFHCICNFCDWLYSYGYTFVFEPLSVFLIVFGRGLHPLCLYFTFVFIFLGPRGSLETPLFARAKNLNHL